MYVVPNWLLAVKISKWPSLFSSNNQVESFKPDNQSHVQNDANLQNLFVSSSQHQEIEEPSIDLPINFTLTTTLIEATDEQPSTTDLPSNQASIDYFEEVVDSNLPEHFPIVFSDFSSVINSSTSTNLSTKPNNNQWNLFYLYLKHLLNCTLPHNTYC